MRKLIFVGVIGLLLVGCSEEKIAINKDMFVGDWRCKTTNYQRFDSGKNEDYGEPKSKSENIVSYKIIDNELYIIVKGKEPIKVNNTSGSESEIVKEHDNDVTTYTQKVSFKDKDNFNINIKIDVKDKSNTSNIIDSRQQKEINCTRIN